MIEPWNLETTNLSRTQQTRYETAVLPTCAIEPHNLHLPYGQDMIHTAWIARECCRRAHEAVDEIVLLPPIPYGVDCNLMDYPMTMHVRQSTLDLMVTDLIESLAHHDVHKIVILNGHGGNDFTPLARQLQCDLDVFIFVCDWWKVGIDKYDEIFTNPDDHAGELETSVMMHLHPELVEMERAASGYSRPSRFDAVRRGWVKNSRDFGKTNDHCAAGNPAEAAPEKGKAYLDVVCDRITEFLIDLTRSPLDADFPLVPNEDSAE